MSLTTFGPEDAITERTSARYRCTFTDLDGTAINGAAIDAITATLVDQNDEVINTRDAQDVLGVNDGSLSGSVFSLVLGESDTVAVGSAELQRRTLVLRVSYSTTGRVVHRVTFYVRNVAQVTN